MNDIIDNLELVYCIEEDGLILLHKCISCPYCVGKYENVVGGNRVIKNYCKNPKIAISLEEQLEKIKSEIEYLKANGQDIPTIYVSK